MDFLKEAFSGRNRFVLRLAFVARVPETKDRSLEQIESELQTV
jgi:hypothetical protein